jgi:hypothetical protein
MFPILNRKLYYVEFKELSDHKTFNKRRRKNKLEREKI